MRVRRLQLIGTTTALAALLSACHSAPTRIFTPYSVAPAAATDTAYVGPSIRVDAVHFPPALDRIEIVSNVAPGELKISDLDHWSAPLGQVARQTLSADLIARLPQGRVIYPHLAKPDGALGLVVDVLEFKADQTGASLEASWVIGSTTPHPGSNRRAVVLRSDQSSVGAAATAQALSVLLGQLADHIVTDLLSTDRS